MHEKKSKKDALSESISVAVESAEEFATMVRYSRHGTRKMTIYAIADGLDKSESKLLKSLTRILVDFNFARRSCESYAEVEAIHHDLSRIVRAFKSDWPIGGSTKRAHDIICQLHIATSPVST